MKISDIKEQLEILKEKQNYRFLSEVQTSLKNLSSNDYLGLAQDLDLKKRFYSQYSPSLSSSSSRLITGSSKEVLEFEAKACEIYGKPCITFNSGFDANSSLIETFYNKNSLILTDKLNHASIYDGILNSGAKFLRYRHLDLVHLEELLIKNRDLYEDILVVSETVYSMDGDVVDIEKLIELKRKYKFTLMIDEAHSYGVFGYGIIYNLGFIEDVDFLVIPLGKGGASMGAMVICDSIYKEYIINKSRKFIFSTALPPVTHQWNLFVLENMNEFDKKRAKLEFLKMHMLKTLEKYNIKTISTTHIISIIIGDKSTLNIITRNLKRKGFLVYGVKEPTVPPKTSRFRIGLNPTLTTEDIDNFVKELRYELDSNI